MNSQTQLRLALLAFTFVLTTTFATGDVFGQCWRKHNTVLPQTYPIWTMWNGIDPFQRTYLPDINPNPTVACSTCNSAPVQANVWVADEAPLDGTAAEAPMAPPAPAESIDDGDQPDRDMSPSDVVADPATTERPEAIEETDGTENLQAQLEEATQRARVAEERAYASEKSARAAQSAAEERIAELEKKIEEADKD